MITMEIDLLRLRNGIDKKIDINTNYSFSKDELLGTDVTSLDDAHIEGDITLNALCELYFSLEVTGTMIIPCAITLKPVPYPFDIVIEGDLEEISTEYTENNKKSLNTIDILPIIWENIVVEIPMRVVSPDVDMDNIDMHGDGWDFVTGEKKNVNSEFSKLYDLLEDSEVK